MRTVRGAAQVRSAVPSYPDAAPAAAGFRGDGGMAAASRAVAVPAQALRARPVCRTFRGEADQIPLVRHFARRYMAERYDCPEEALGDILLCVTELATNAVQHTLSGLGGQFTVVLHGSGPRIRVEVIDGGPRQGGDGSRHGDAGEDDDFFLHGGLGLRLVSAHSDQMGYAERARCGVAWFERTWADGT